MEILIFQIIIAAIIIYFGRDSLLKLIAITIVAITFTGGMVKTNPLMLLQFVTIAISFTYCLNYKKESSTENNTCIRPVKIKIERKKGSAEISIRILINVILSGAIVIGFYKWIRFCFSDDDGFLIFLGIMNFCMFGSINYVIITFLLNRIDDLWKEF